MKKATKTEVLIAGAGPVGLCAALALARRGVAVEILDSAPHATTHSYALTLHPATIDLFEEFGLLERVLAGSRKVERVDFFQDRRRAAAVDLASGSLRNPYWLVVGQDHIETALEEALAGHGVRVRWKHRLAGITPESESVRVSADELEDRVIGYAVAHGEGFVRRSKTFEAAFLIGADGFDSFVRRNLGIGFPEVAGAEDFAVFEFEAECGTCEPVQIVETNGLANVRWPLDGGGCRWSFQLDRDGTPPEYLRKKDFEVIQRIDHTAADTLDESRLHELLTERVPWCPAVVKGNYWNLWARFERRLAERFGFGRIWLAGDAGHTTGPVGVQSMNVGLREAVDLTERITGVLGGSADLGTFEDYNRERVSEWRFLLGLDGGLEPTSAADPQLAESRARLLSRLPASGEGLEIVARKLGFRLSGWSPPVRSEKANVSGTETR